MGMRGWWRAYAHLARGAAELSRRRAGEVTWDLLGKGGTRMAGWRTRAEEVGSVGVGNRDRLARLARFEVERALGAVGVATAAEVADLAARVQDLERERRAASARAATADVDAVAAAFGPERS